MSDSSAHGLADDPAESSGPASRYRWVILAAGTAAQSTFAAAQFGLPALAPALRSQYRLSLGETGVLLGAIGFGFLATTFAWGLLADRIGERVVIPIGLTGMGAALAASAITDSYPVLVGLLIVAGALGTSANAASGRAVMGWFGPNERGLALGIRQASAPIGGAGAAAALPWLATVGGTRLAFFVLAGGCVAGGSVASVFLREVPADGHPALEKIAAPFRDAGKWLLAGGSSLYLLAQIATTQFVVLFLHDHRGLSTHAAAAVLAGMNVLAIGARVSAGRWSDRVGDRLGPLRLIGFVLSAWMTLIAALVDAPMAALLPAFVVAGVLSLSWNSLAFTAAAEMSGYARSGAALGFQQMVLGVIIAIGPPAFAVVVGATSWRVAFCLVAAGPLVGALALRQLPRPARLRDAQTLGTSAIPPTAL